MNQENALTIQKVLSEKNQFNLAMPFTTSRQVNPYYKASVALLTVDTRDEAGQIFKVGSKRIEGQNGRGEFVNLYSLTKPFLMKLATEAGIQFSPNSGDVVKMDDNTWKASAFGAIKLPDGTVRTSRNFKIIDLQTEEKKLRLGYQEKAEKGQRQRSGRHKKYIVNISQGGRPDKRRVQRLSVRIQIGASSRNFREKRSRFCGQQERGRADGGQGGHHSFGSVKNRAGNTEMCSRPFLRGYKDCALS